MQASTVRIGTSTSWSWRYTALRCYQEGGEGGGVGTIYGVLEEGVSKWFTHAAGPIEVPAVPDIDEQGVSLAGREREHVCGLHTHNSRIQLKSITSVSQTLALFLYM